MHEVRSIARDFCCNFRSLTNTFKGTHSVLADYTAAEVNRHYATELLIRVKNPAVVFHHFKSKQQRAGARMLDQATKWGTQTTVIIDVGFFYAIPLCQEVVLIDYRCEIGRFPVSVSCLTISNPDSLSSSETRINTEIRS